MNSTLHRQLKDIQIQAEKLISGSPSGEELVQFSNYSAELKNYLLINIEEPEIRVLIYSIPDILDVEIETKSMPVALVITLTIITLGISALYISHVMEMRRHRLVQGNIQTARGKYASIEFLLKAYA